MRSVTYRTRWAYAGPSQRRHGDLVDLVLDIFYLVNLRGVIPPRAVLNEVLSQGRSGGGMSPETAWRPFTITPEEYAELVQALVALDLATATKNHPYMSSIERFIVDDELNECTEYGEWLRRLVRKYPHDQ